MSLDLFKRAETIFWDFDGVIKDSVEVKSDAYELLFLPFGKDIGDAVKKHHEENGGMSRFYKLPIYIEWAGQEPTQQRIKNYEQKFSDIVKKK